MTQELKAYNVVATVDVNPEVVDNLGCTEWAAYGKDEVDAVLAAKDAEIAELKTKLENVDELVKAANKFVSDLKSSDCSKKDEEIRNLKQSVKFFSETLERERESAKKCFMKLHDDGLLMGWGLTNVFFVMPKYTKERLAKLEEQESDTPSCVPDDNEYGFTHDFAWALRMLKNGCRIHRSGWNGKGMYAVLQKGYPDGIPCNKQTAEAWGLKEGDLFRCEPYMQLKMVNGSHSMWVPSVNDCLSNDWAIVVTDAEPA